MRPLDTSSADRTSKIWTFFWSSSFFRSSLFGDREGVCGGQQHPGGPGGQCPPALLLPHFGPPGPPQHHLDRHPQFGPAPAAAGVGVRAGRGGRKRFRLHRPGGVCLLAHQERHHRPQRHARHGQRTVPMQRGQPSGRRRAQHRGAPAHRLRPKCSREGNQDEGGSLQFSCTVGEGMPMPTFTWEKIPPDSQPLVMTYEDDRRALLTLRNLTADASGLYRCTASNMLGSISCALELHIHVTPDGATSLVVGITLMLTMGLVLLALFALVLWLHHYSVRKRREMDEDEDDSHNEIRIDNFSLGRLIVAKSPSGEGTGANPVAKPLWIFTSSTPNTTYAHREWRPEPGNASQAPLPGGFRQPTPACQGRWRRPSASEQQESSSRDSEEKHPVPGHFPKPTGFLV